MLEWCHMLTFPNIDPVAIELGQLKIRWYGISYVVGILLAWWLLKLRARKLPRQWTLKQVSDLVFYCTIGIILGGRLGSVLFYNLPFYMDNPISVFKIWQGGMSFHGGFLGVVFAIAYFSRKEKIIFFTIADFLMPVVPVGLLFGRIANFVNGELWGKPSDVAWAMVFLHVDNQPRHPSQLYEIFLEGFVLFSVLWLLSSKPKPTMFISGMFLTLYGIFRVAVEMFREPDRHIGYLLGDWLTMGMLLSLPMVVVGVLLLFLAIRNKDITQDWAPGS